MEINSRYNDPQISIRSHENENRQSQRQNLPENSLSKQAGEAQKNAVITQASLVNSTTLFAAQTIGQAEKSEPVKGDKQNNGELSKEEKEAVKALQERDREVRAHERAHATRGGQYAGQPKLSFETGPDGRRYAVSGEVSIDASPIKGNPKATIEKLRVVKAAALAPAKPSGQDRSVASSAEAGIRAAQAELNAERAEELKESLKIDEDENTKANFAL